MRKVFLTAFLISSISNTAYPQLSDSIYAKWLFTPEIKQGFDFALAAAKLTYKDFAFRPDYWEVDSARMNTINMLMANPLYLSHKSLETASSLKDRSLPWTINSIANENIGGLYTPTIYKIKMDSGWITVHDGFIHTDQHLIPELAEQLANRARRFPEKPKLKSAFFTLLAAIELSKLSKVYNREEMGFIQNQFPRVVLEDTIEEKLSVDEQDSIQKLEEKITQQFVPLANRSRYVFGYGRSLQDFFSNINLSFVSLNIFSQDTLKTKKEIIWEDKNYKAIIGGPGPNHYKGDYALIIDLGGDDTYELTRRPNFENQIIIDLGGNDKYFALEDYALACGYFGYSVLIDVAGDDLYQGKNFSVGCGFFGCGLLWDQAGNDTYIGDQFTQGAGGFGIGILKDDGGNDRYQAALMGQGFGFVRGVGALLDAQGSDNYFAGGKYKEQIGLSGEIRYLSESQGYATGIRPDLSGGMGFLFDYDGDDSYNIDMFGQGSSYWWGLGALVDFKGNDRYIAQQYAQGAGIHMSLGCLVDSSGNDFYYSKGVSQGCGHDLGAGMLFDLSGNDNYVATDGSQAYGSANGFGILVDGAGNDGYYVKDKMTTQGAGNPRREYGSIAIFLDAGGTDHYDGNGGENRIWKPTGTTWGVGVDGNFGSVDTLQVKK